MKRFDVTIRVTSPHDLAVLIEATQPWELVTVRPVEVDGRSGPRLSRTYDLGNRRAREVGVGAKTVKDYVLEIMRRDPEKEWSQHEISKLITDQGYKPNSASPALSVLAGEPKPLVQSVKKGSFVLTARGRAT